MIHKQKEYAVEAEPESPYFEALVKLTQAKTQYYSSSKHPAAAFKYISRLNTFRKISKRHPGAMVDIESKSSFIINEFIPQMNEVFER